MVTLSIVRHAKSSWDDPSLRDIERPLNSRGKSQALTLGVFLAENIIAPDLVICSPAKRARQTLKYLQKNWKSTSEVIVDKHLYLASVNTILMLLDEHGGKARHIMIVGHNPGLHMLADRLASKGEEDDLALLQEKYPTGTLCVIKSNVDNWKKIGKAAGKLIYLATPKQLASL